MKLLAKFACAAAAVATSTAVIASAHAQDIVAVRWNGDVYGIRSDDGSGALIGYSGTNSFDCLTRDDDGRFLLLRRFNFGVISIDPHIGDALWLGDIFLDDVRGLARRSPGFLNAVDDGGINQLDRLYSVNLNNGTFALMGTCNHGKIEALALAPDDTLYAWDTEAGLLTVDPNTGATTDVSTQFSGSTDIYSLAFSPDGRLFGARYSLYEIDVNTGETALIGAGPYADIRGIAFIEEEDKGCLQLDIDHLAASENSRFTVSGPDDGTTIALVYGLHRGLTEVQGQFGYCAQFGIRSVNQNRVVAQGQIQNGEFSVQRRIPVSVQNDTLYFQAAERGTCPEECTSVVKAREVE